jgi:hypothetical protein
MALHMHARRQALSRFDESNEDEASGVNKTLATIEHMAEVGGDCGGWGWVGGGGERRWWWAWAGGEYPLMETDDQEGVGSG